MRAALWLLALFGVAVAVALFAGSNQGTVTVFWPPYRVDLSLNMVLVLLLAAFLLLHAALRGLDTLAGLPLRARRWRMLQRERAMHGALLDSLTQLLAGRFLRARRAAEAAIAQERSLAEGPERVAHGRQLRVLAHLLVAEAAHALQDSHLREAHLQYALDSTSAAADDGGEAELREGAQLRAARWALDERDAEAALERLASLPVGASRRTLALRARLKAARLTGQHGEALDTARLLAKHHAFSPAAAASIVRGLVLERIGDARDSGQLEQVWASLESAERAMPEVAIHAAQRLAQLGGEPVRVRAWLLPVWERLAKPDAQAPLPEGQARKLIAVLQDSLGGLDAAWLARIEAASQARSHDARLHYLSAMACLQRGLWGKAQQLLAACASQLPDAELRANAWRALATLAEQRGDTAAAAQAWKAAAQAGIR